MSGDFPIAESGFCRSEQRMVRIWAGLFGVLSVGFAALFVADLRGYFNVASDPIAILQESGGTVRRLGNHQLTWDRAATGTLFGSGDTLSTGEGATARIQFYAGGELILEPGAMVVLGGSVEELKLNFVSGAGKVRVAREAQKKIQVSRGTEKTPVNASASGKRLSGAANSGVVVETVDDLKVAPVPSAAEVRAGRVLAPSTPIAEKTAATTPSALEAPSLTKAIQEKTIRNIESALKIDSTKLMTALEIPKPPVLAFPDENAVMDLWAKEQPREFRWQPSEKSKEAAKEYEVFLKPLEGENRKLRIVKSKEPVLRLKDVPSGRYQWSVRVVTNSGRRSPAATPRTVEIRGQAALEAPTLFPVRVQ